MPNKENLKPKDSNQSREEAKINGKKGGLQLGENNRKRKSYKEIFDLLQNCPVKKDKTISIQKEVDDDIVSVNVNLIDYLKEKYPNLSDDEITNATFASIKMLELINHPDAKVAIKAFEVVRDTSGQKPVDKIEVKDKEFSDKIDYVD